MNSLSKFTVLNTTGATISVTGLELSVTSLKQVAFDTTQPVLDALTGSGEFMAYIDSGELAIRHRGFTLPADRARDFLEAAVTPIAFSLVDAESIMSGLVTATAPPSPFHGQPWLDPSDMINYGYDAARTAWMTSRFPLFYGKEGSCKNRYITPAAGSGTPTGHMPLLRDIMVAAIIIEFTAKRNNSQVTFSIYEDFAPTGGSFTINCDKGITQYINASITVPLTATKHMQIYCASSDRIHDVGVTLDCAWRK